MSVGGTKPGERRSLFRSPRVEISVPLRLGRIRAIHRWVALAPLPAHFSRTGAG
ncbi:hypothetical protein SCA6_019239 [Theobroma cacao]